MLGAGVGSSWFAGIRAQRKVVGFDGESERCRESKVIAVNTKPLHASLRLRQAVLYLLAAGAALSRRQVGHHNR